MEMFIFVIAEKLFMKDRQPAGHSFIRFIKENLRCSGESLNLGWGRESSNCKPDSLGMTDSLFQDN